MNPKPITILVFSLALLAAGCGGGSGGSPSTPSGASSALVNKMQLTVSSGPYNGYINAPFTSVTICAPGTSSCQTISGILVDTGSYGLRIFASKLNVALKQETQSQSGGEIGECAVFGSFAGWGPVKTAEVKLAGERPITVPIHVFNDASFNAAPTACTQYGAPMLSTASQAGFNGILGVGLLRHDCGQACSTSSSNGAYYSCTQQSCTGTAEPLSEQVQNPVWLLPVDNNGVLISLPHIGASGAPSVNGSLIFGIGTESNNKLGSAKVYSVDSAGNFTTTYKANSLPNSFIDSGSNGFFFPDSSITQCPSSSNAPGFYCPSSTLSLSAVNAGQNGTTGTVDFQVANANNLFAGGNTAFSNIGGPLPGFAGAFDWGLPFFFGRTVFVAINGQSSPGGIGPYWAY